MAWPVSIGDAIMLSTLAYRLGQTFTSGRKSAPAQFAEVQNQLYSLSQALEFLGTQDAKSAGDAGESQAKAATVLAQQDDILGRMISNCRLTLRHLEELVGKYTELGDEPDPPSRKRWRKEIMENWKKIRWTTEGGDLDKLKSNLAVHISGLTLAISAINRLVNFMSTHSTL